MSGLAHADFGAEWGGDIFGSGKCLLVGPSPALDLKKTPAPLSGAFPFLVAVEMGIHR